jgi:hypothetical protein
MRTEKVEPFRGSLRTTIAPPTITSAPPATGPAGADPAGALDGIHHGDGDGMVRVPLGRLFGTRAGDKGGDANLGVWARGDDAHDWLRRYLTVDALRELLPETAELDVDRFELPNLRAVNFLVHGLLGDGVGGSTRFDPQAKSLGEWLRAREVWLPRRLLAGADPGGPR